LILCADDDPTVLEVLRYILEGTGYQVVTADDGVEAVTLARTKSIDLALLDIKMPGRSDLEVLEELKADDPDFYAIMVSGVEDIDITMEAMGKGAHDYIGKPIDARQLLASVKQALELKRVALWESTHPQDEKWARRPGR
jgi:DNA-binding NtrC family response regulator